MSKRIRVFSLMIAGAMVLSPALALAQGGGGGGAGAPGGGAAGAGTGGNSAPAATGTEQPKPSGMNKSDGSAPSASPSTSPSGVSGTTPGSGTMSSPSASPATGDFMGRHTMTGEVTRIDGKSGKFSLKTKDGTLDLHAPPSALSGVKSGDQLSVEIAVKPMK